MDDYKLSNLSEAKNEYCARLINILTPLIKDGFKSIFDEAVKLCKENNEDEKYLMTYQNFLTRIPKWNDTIIEEEVERIKNKSRCSYLNDLLTCVHILQLKVMTSIRVGQIPKKVDIDIPELKKFIHGCYNLIARKFYTNVYLFDITVPPLQFQMHNRECENIIRECILNRIRESIPIENILKSYLDETDETNIEEEVIEQYIDSCGNEINKEDIIEENKEEDKIIKTETGIGNIGEINKNISFNDIDQAISTDKINENITAPKDIERLEEISKTRNIQRKLEEEEEEEEDKIKIHDTDINLNIESIEQKKEEVPIELNIETL